MKTKILFLAAMLLMSANIFAQNIVKGDVNEDGNVDVADVVAVISIMQKGGGVAILPSSVEFDKNEYGVGIDKELKLKATILPTYATDKTLTWTSSNPSVATVSQEGVVKGIAEGSTTITVSTANGKQSTCVVTVSAVVYYLYVGQTDPSTMTEISPIVTSTTEGGGWYELGTNLPTSIELRITGGETGKIWYEAIPVDANLVAGSSSDPDTSVTKGSIVTIPSTNGVQYQIWINNGAKSSRHSLSYNK